MSETIVVPKCGSDGLGLFVTRNKELLLLLDLLHNFDVHLQNVGDSVGWCQREPLGQRNISNPIALVELDPDKRLGFGGVFNIVTCARVGG
jgi:hypothetical protein